MKYKHIKLFNLFIFLINMASIINTFNINNPTPLYVVDGENINYEMLGHRAMVIDDSVTLQLYNGIICNIDVPTDSYFVPDSITGIDKIGVFTKLQSAADEARMFRPFVNIFKPGERHIRQWEYDRYCYENSRPDSPYYEQYKKCKGNIIVWEYILNLL